MIKKNIRYTEKKMKTKETRKEEGNHYRKYVMTKRNKEKNKNMINYLFFLPVFFIMEIGCDLLFSGSMISATNMDKKEDKENNQGIRE